MSNIQENYMLKALAIAKDAAKQNEVPVGAILVDTKTGDIIASSGNLTEKLQDPTAHAEVNVIREACKIKNNWHLDECDLYVTLEPCPMCAQAISFARIRRLFFAAYDTKSGGVEHGARIFDAISCHHKPEIYGGIKEKESAELLQEFFKERRN